MKARTRLNPQTRLRRLALTAAALPLALLAPLAANAQSLSRFERQRGLEMLRMVESDLQKNYYDPTFRGIDMKARFKQASELIEKATSNGQVFGIIASVLIELNDSHTTFLPPSRVARTEYGWEMQMIGDTCYVTAVRPGSDAEAKGVRPGDAVLAVDGMRPTRDDLWKIKYLTYALRPREAMHVALQSPDGRQRELEIKSRIVEGRQVTDLTNYTEYMRQLLEEEKEARLYRARFAEIGQDAIIWKMAGFNLTEDREVDAIMSRVRKFNALVLDLRGNGGGYVTMLERLVGHMFDRDVKIADLKGRKEIKPSVAKGRGKDAFGGRVVVLVDSQSGSAAEVFARVMQLEKRGVVVGDRSSGKVMQSRVYPREVGVERVAFFGTNISNADLVMADGKSLEHVGVTPDELLLPTAADLTAGRDPVLARACEMAGIKLDPAKAGALFPVEWRK